MKSLCNILNCGSFLELLLVPKAHKRNSNSSSASKKEIEEEDFDKIDHDLEYMCPNCGKNNPSADECDHCSKNDSMSAALSEVFSYLAKVQ